MGSLRLCRSSVLRICQSRSDPDRGLRPGRPAHASRSIPVVLGADGWGVTHGVRRCGPGSWWTGAVSVMAAPGIPPPAAFVPPYTSKTMMRILAPQTGQASGRVSYDCRDAGARAPRVGALGDARSGCRGGRARRAKRCCELLLSGTTLVMIGTSPNVLLSAQG
jgi:hypothetical protein